MPLPRYYQKAVKEKVLSRKEAEMLWLDMRENPDKPLPESLVDADERLNLWLTPIREMHQA